MPFIAVPHRVAHPVPTEFEACARLRTVLGASPLLWEAGWATLASVVIFAISAAALPIVVARLPEDHFSKHRPEVHRHGRSLAVLVLRNVFGGVLLLAGLAMLIMPGPGVACILAGLAMMSFPGKLALERRIVKAPHVLDALNRVRARANVPPLRLD